MVGLKWRALAEDVDPVQVSVADGSVGGRVIRRIEGIPGCYARSFSPGLTRVMAALCYPRQQPRCDKSRRREVFPHPGQDCSTAIPSHQVLKCMGHGIFMLLALDRSIRVDCRGDPRVSMTPPRPLQYNHPSSPQSGNLLK